MIKDLYFKGRYSQNDLDAMKLDNQLGEYAIRNEDSFNKHLKRLHKATQIARDKFPSLKGKQNNFVKYVLSMEPLKYSMWAT